MISGECAPRGSNPRRHGLRVHRSTTELEAPGAGGESRTLTGVSPPGSELGASFLFRHARMVDPTGLEPARVSLQTRCTATRALGPRSRWVESNDRRHNAARVTAALL